METTIILFAQIMINEPPPLNREYNRDPNAKAH